MTTPRFEICSFRVLGNSDDVETVIFDEIHYLLILRPRTTWEESIILCPDHNPAYLPSATATNAAEISGWTGVPTVPSVSSHNKRPVRLRSTTSTS